MEHVTLGLRELKSQVMPVRTRTEGVCRTLKNMCTVNAMIGLNWVMFQNIIIMNITTCQRASTEAEHSTNCIPDRSKVIFNDVVKELLGETPARHFLGTSNEMQGVDVWGYEESSPK